MRTQHLLIAFVFSFASCNSEKKQSTSKDDVTSNEKKADETQTSHDKKNESNGYWEKLVMHELREASGMVAALMPLPSSWTLNTGAGPFLTGPNGIKVTDFPARNFMDNYNPSLQRSYEMSGQQMRAMPGIEQLIQQDIIPRANSQGLQFVKYYEVPEISKMDKWYSDQLYAALPARSDVGAFGTEWKMNNGNPYFLLIHLNVKTSQAMQTWYYRSSGLEADPEHFEAARKQYIFALANTRYNLEPIMAYNQKEAQRVGQSWAAFNQRMAQNQANFEASQRAFVNKSNAINDAIMNGWRERNASGDRQQEQAIDGIYEQTNVQDPTSGNQYKVAEGSNQYWMNGDGEYIGTKLQGYDPNLDDNMNEQKWQELKKVKN